MSELGRKIWELLTGPVLDENALNQSSHWVQLGDWNLVSQIAVATLVILTLALTIWNVRKAKTTGGKFLVVALRIAVLAVLLFAFYQPAQLEETHTESTNAILLLMDDSESMNLGTEKENRREAVLQFIQEQRENLRALEEKNVVETYLFGTDLRTSDWKKLDQDLTGSQQNTYILNSLRQLSEQYRNQDVGGIVLVSDGIGNGADDYAVSNGSTIDRSALARRLDLTTPIHTITLGEQSFRDISVHAIRTASFAFKRNTTSIEADIRVHGYKSGELEIELLEEDRLVKTAKIPIEKGKTDYTISFDFTPEKIGDHVYAVRSKAFPNEITTENNERHAVIRVARDKIRILQIGGHPSWDIRFLRNHLREKPGIQLISFFILVNTNSTLGVTNTTETALIPFPAEELFVNELPGFDLIVFQDFNYGPFSTPQHLHRVRDYVKNGGAFLMIGGRLAMTAGGYNDTELVDILPVDLTPTRRNDAMLDTTFFLPTLTPNGESHAITRLRNVPAENRKQWQAMPQWEGLNKTNGLANGGRALLAHPKLRTGNGQPMPVLAVTEVGHGRSAVVTSDSLWRWKLPMVGQGGDDQLYDTFVSNLIRWLIRDPELSLLRLQATHNVRALNESIPLEVRAFTPDYKPAANQSVTLQIFRRPESNVPDQEPVLVEEHHEQTDNLGRWPFAFKSRKPGIYDAVAKMVSDGRQLVDKTVFVINDERAEMRETGSNNRMLAAISQLTGGQSQALSEGLDKLSLRPPRVTEVSSRQMHERWNVPGIFVLVCLLFGMEWLVRHKMGLV